MILLVAFIIFIEATDAEFKNCNPPFGVPYNIVFTVQLFVLTLFV
jgi:hypothetical protein